MYELSVEQTFNRWFIFSGEDQHCLVWDISSGEMMGQMKGHTDTIYTMAYSRDGAVMATGIIYLYLIICDPTHKMAVR